MFYTFRQVTGSAYLFPRRMQDASVVTREAREGGGTGRGQLLLPLLVECDWQGGVCAGPHTHQPHFFQGGVAKWQN